MEKQKKEKIEEEIVEHERVCNYIVAYKKFPRIFGRGMYKKKEVVPYSDWNDKSWRDHDCEKFYNQWGECVHPSHFDIEFDFSVKVNGEIKPDIRIPALTRWDKKEIVNCGGKFPRKIKNAPFSDWCITDFWEWEGWRHGVTLRNKIINRRKRRRILLLKQTIREQSIPFALPMGEQEFGTIEEAVNFLKSVSFSEIESSGKRDDSVVKFVIAHNNNGKAVNVGKMRNGRIMIQDKGGGCWRLLS